jgi:hypothetical protein
MHSQANIGQTNFKPISINTDASSGRKKKRIDEFIMKDNKLGLVR